MKIRNIVLAGAAAGLLLALITSCNMTPDQNCAEICHRLNMEPTFTTIAGNPHACDCKGK